MDHELHPSLTLPLQVVGVADVMRLLRELNNIEDSVHQSELRQPGHASTQLPRISRLMNEFTETNHLNLLQKADRSASQEYLRNLRLSAPTIHVSFASDPPAAFVGKLLTWLRSNLDPQMLLQIGLEPTIAAGCIVRTPNKMFDFSLRKRFDEQRQLLIDKLGITQ